MWQAMLVVLTDTEQDGPYMTKEVIGTAATLEDLRRTVVEPEKLKQNNLDAEARARKVYPRCVEWMIFSEEVGDQ